MDVIMDLTLPQIGMLNYGSRINHERSERRRKSTATKSETKRVKEEADPIAWNGKRLSQLNSEEQAAYMSVGF